MEYIIFSLSCQNVDIYLNIDVLCSVAKVYSSWGDTGFSGGQCKPSL